MPSAATTMAAAQASKNAFIVFHLAGLAECESNMMPGYVWYKDADRHDGSPLTGPYVFFAMVQSWGLAAVLSFATGPFYAYALLPSRPGGISALTDQQLGGGVMWVPGAITYSIVFVALLFQWLAEEDRRSQIPAAVTKPGHAHGG